MSACHEAGCFQHLEQSKRADAKQAQQYRFDPDMAVISGTHHDI